MGSKYFVFEYRTVYGFSILIEITTVKKQLSFSSLTSFPAIVCPSYDANAISSNTQLYETS